MRISTMSSSSEIEACSTSTIVDSDIRYPLPPV
jgi:hypothetical protein